MKGKIGRPKKSDQTRDNKQAIIDAAIDIIRAGKASSVTVRNVCARSSVSIGTFYHYFKDKDDDGRIHRYIDFYLPISYD